MARKACLKLRRAAFFFAGRKCEVWAKLLLAGQHCPVNTHNITNCYVVMPGIYAKNIWECQLKAICKDHLKELSHQSTDTPLR